ncbi:uncharacterized protein LOC125838861 [Solanum verrucosum]|uniref:uncharacterized protein LOC125838861 n=1 Tax=Solanum verrucosum TaxID=315347 RepID=UPI0020D115CE|nr:uncharacterized protein LOC125838861 [Solanum verrucosum]
MSCPGCSCESSKTYVEHFEYQRHMQFLLGLNESYNQSRSQIMMLDPAPGVNKAFSLVMVEESQRILGKSNTTGSDHSVSANAGGMNEAMAFFSNGKGHIPRSGSTSQSGSNPSTGAGFRSNHKQFNNNSTLYCGFNNALGLLMHHHNASTWNSQGATNDSSFSKILTTGSSGYMQLLQLIEPDNAKSNCDTTTTAHASGMMICPSLIPDADKWIIDTGASKHMDLSSGNVRGPGTLVNDLYVIHVDTQLKTQGTQLKSQQDQTTNANVVSSTSPNNLVLWHQRLGHVPSSCTYTPQQNGVVERKHRHVLEMARSLRFQSHLPLRFWGECVLTSVYLINRIPSTVLKGKTHYELLYKTLPSLDHLRVFGCLAFASEVKKTDKFSSRVVPAVFLGYSSLQKFSSFPVLQFTGDTSTDLLCAELPLCDQAVPEPSDFSLNPQSSSHVPLPPLPISSHVSVSLRKSSRPIKPPIWMTDFITPKSRSACFYHVSDSVSYDLLSASYDAAFAAYSSIYEPISFAEASSHPQWVDAMKAEISALCNTPTFQNV